MKQIIRLTESELHGLIQECIREIIYESLQDEGGTFNSQKLAQLIQQGDGIYKVKGAQPYLNRVNDEQVLGPYNSERDAKKDTNLKGIQPFNKKYIYLNNRKVLVLDVSDLDNPLDTFRKDLASSGFITANDDVERYQPNTQMNGLAREVAERFGVPETNVIVKKYDSVFYLIKVVENGNSLYNLFWNDTPFSNKWFTTFIPIKKGNSNIGAIIGFGNKYNILKSDHTKAFVRNVDNIDYTSDKYFYILERGKQFNLSSKEGELQSKRWFDYLHRIDKGTKIIYAATIGDFQFNIDETDKGLFVNGKPLKDMNFSSLSRKANNIIEDEPEIVKAPNGKMNIKNKKGIYIFDHWPDRIEQNHDHETFTIYYGKNKYIFNRITRELKPIHIEKKDPERYKKKRPRIPTKAV